MSQLSLIPRQKKILGSGVVHIPDWLTIERQQALLVLLRHWTKGGWFTPVLPNGTAMRHPIACLGWQWKPYEYFDARVPMPGELIITAVEALIDAGLDEYLPFSPDTCIINMFPPSSSLGMHQDKSEDRELIDGGSPIITLSLGDTGVFRLASVNAPTPYQEVELRSGDLIIMSGHSRLAYHSINRIIPDTAPFDLDMKPGRISLTMRRARA